MASMPMLEILFAKLTFFLLLYDRLIGLYDYIVHADIVCACALLLKY